MYKVENSADIYFILDVHKRKISLLGKKDDLIKKLVKAILASYQDPERWNWGPYYSELNLTGKDMVPLIKLQIFPFKESEYNIRRYVFLDGYGRIVDIRNFKEEIICKMRAIKSGNFAYPEELYFQWYTRIQPPISKYNVGTPPKVKSVKIFNAIPEYKDFVKGKDRQLVRKNKRIIREKKSWKEHKSKSRYQWSKKAKSRTSIRYLLPHVEDVIDLEKILYEDFLLSGTLMVNE